MEEVENSNQEFKECRYILDSRELKLKELLEEPECKQLDLGDIHFVNEREEILWIVERKTIDDLSASIKDKRSREQRSRLISFCRPRNIKIMYVIEGFFDKRNSKSKFLLPRKTLISALLNLMTRDHIFVHHTINLEESAEYIRTFSAKIVEFQGNPLSKLKGEVEYLKELQTTKRDNKNPKNVFLLQLATIPKVSLKYAEAIASEYPNWKQLIHAFENEKKPEKLLSEIKIELNTRDKNGKYKTRRLGDVVSKQIYDFILTETS